MQAGTDDRRHAQPAKTLAQGGEPAVVEWCEPGFSDLQGLRAEFLAKRDEPLQSAAVRIGARRPATLQAESIGQSVGVQSDFKHGMSRLWAADRRRLPRASAGRHRR